MRMESPIGDLDIKFEKIIREGDELVILSKAGLWDARIYIKKSELMSVLKVTLCRTAIRFFFSALFSRKGKEEPEGAESDL